MDIKLTTVGSVGTVYINGRFDFKAHKFFKAAYDQLLPQKDISHLVINLAAVSYMDSSALGMLLLVNERAQAEGKLVELSRANSTVRQILDIANFDKLFAIS